MHAGLVQKPASLHLVLQEHEHEQELLGINAGLPGTLPSQDAPPAQQHP